MLNPQLLNLFVRILLLTLQSPSHTGTEHKANIFNPQWQNHLAAYPAGEIYNKLYPQPACMYVCVCRGGGGCY